MSFLNTFFSMGPTQGHTMNRMDRITRTRLMGRSRKIVAEPVYTRLLMKLDSIMLPRMLARMKGAVGTLNL